VTFVLDGGEWAALHPVYFNAGGRYLQSPKVSLCIIKFKHDSYFSVFSHLNSKWQYIAQLYETGGMDEENTDTQVSVLVCSVNLKACFLLSHERERERERPLEVWRKLCNDVPNLYCFLHQILLD